MMEKMTREDAERAILEAEQAYEAAARQLDDARNRWDIAVAAMDSAKEGLQMAKAEVHLLSRVPCQWSSQYIRKTGREQCGELTHLECDGIPICWQHGGAYRTWRRRGKAMQRGVAAGRLGICQWTMNFKPNRAACGRHTARKVDGYFLCKQHSRSYERRRSKTSAEALKVNIIGDPA